jgi:hypothetical protein
MSSPAATARATLLACAMAWPLTAAADDPPGNPALPALRFAADALGDGFYEQIRLAPQFQKMNREALGSPVELRIYHTYRINRGGATATGLLSAVTLGILPQVSSGDHTIVYEILVNGTTLSIYKYSKSLTHAHNLWTGADTTFGMGKDGVDWAKSTVQQFLKDAATDPRLSALTAEFDYYFGAAKP